MKRRTHKARGGFYPSIMSGLVKTGPYFVTVAVAQGSKLIRNNKSRMASRRARRRTKRTRR